MFACLAESCRSNFVILPPRGINPEYHFRIQRPNTDEKLHVEYVPLLNKNFQLVILANRLIVSFVSSPDLNIKSMTVGIGSEVISRPKWFFEVLVFLDIFLQKGLIPTLKDFSEFNQANGFFSPGWIFDKLVNVYHTAFSYCSTKKILREIDTGNSYQYNDIYILANFCAEQRMKGDLQNKDVTKYLEKFCETYKISKTSFRLWGNRYPPPKPYMIGSTSVEDHREENEKRNEETTEERVEERNEETTEERVEEKAEEGDGRNEDLAKQRSDIIQRLDVIEEVTKNIVEQCQNKKNPPVLPPESVPAPEPPAPLPETKLPESIPSPEPLATIRRNLKEELGKQLLEEFALTKNISLSKTISISFGSPFALELVNYFRSLGFYVVANPSLATIVISL